ncbi:DUF59 domain-containing protein [Alphaproteobacteria bacterium]|nr:DUF59 domain-containing protein [Alphaproteobacteria bacterium]
MKVYIMDPKVFTDLDDNNIGKDHLYNDKIISALKTVYDPEIPVDIYELGLIYSIDVVGDHINAKMTLTSPGCPVAGTMPRMVELALLTVEGINSVDVNLVWEPPWNKTLMSEVAKLELGME